MAVQVWARLAVLLSNPDVCHVPATSKLVSEGHHHRRCREHDVVQCLDAVVSVGSGDTGHSAAPTPIAGTHQGSTEGSVWVLVGGFLVIAVHVVVPDRHLVALICMMVYALLLHHWKRFASTIRPNRSLAPTRTWAGKNTVGWCRGRRRLTIRSCRLVRVLGPPLIAAHRAAVRGRKDGLPLE